MTTEDLVSGGYFEVLNKPKKTAVPLTKPYCCDLLSFAMGKAPAGCVWCTVMANMNTLAVAALAEAACVILCEGARADEKMLEKAKSEKITLLRTEEPVFETALWVYGKINDKAQL